MAEQEEHSRRISIKQVMKRKINDQRGIVFVLDLVISTTL
jgi:hypothetical protein